MASHQLVRITSAHVEKEFPEFDGILYKALDDPAPGELTYTSADLEGIDLAGKPIFIEHDETLGKVGVIVQSMFMAPNLGIRGRIDTSDLEIREQIRAQLKSGTLRDLSIGFGALRDTRTGEYSHKTFNEASLCRKGYYNGTQVVSVRASQAAADSNTRGTGAQVEGPVVLENPADVLDLLNRKTASTDRSRNPDSTGKTPYITGAGTNVNTRKSQLQPQAVRVTATRTQEYQNPPPTTQPGNPSPTMDQQNRQTQAEQHSGIPGEQPDPATEDLAAQDTGVETVDTDGKTRQEVINEWRGVYEKTQQASLEQLKKVEAEKDQQAAELEELRSFKRTKTEEYGKNQEADLARVNKKMEEHGLPGAKDRYSEIARNPDFKDMWDSTKILVRDAEAKDAEITEWKKKFKSLKRKQDQTFHVSQPPPVAQAVAVKSGGQRISTIGGATGHGMRALPGASLYDVLRNDYVGRQHPTPQVQRPGASVQPAAMETRNPAEAYGNQSVIPMDQDQVAQFQDQYAAQRQHMGYGQQAAAPVEPTARPVFQKITAGCSRGRDIMLQNKETRSRYSGFFKRSMCEAAPDLWDELIGMPRSGTMPVIDGACVGNNLMNQRFQNKSSGWVPPQ